MYLGMFNQDKSFLLLTCENSAIDVRFFFQSHIACFLLEICNKNHDSTSFKRMSLFHNCLSLAAKWIISQVFLMK